MMKKYLLALSLLCIQPVISLEVEDLSWEDTGPSAQEFHALLQNALENKNWWAVIDYADILSYHFPESPFSQDAALIIGEAYLQLDQPFLANQYFTHYLNQPNVPKYFEKAIEYKFNIAERFRLGEKKPLFNSHKGPKLLPAEEDALAIYDEVLATVPHSEFAARALLGKAKIQASMEDFKPCIETLDLLIRRFPKHDLAAAAYLEKNAVYHMQCLGKSLDPALLDLAEVNLRKFRTVFPREPRLQEASQYLQKMEEIFASHLLETGRFFEKTHKIPAAKIYFRKVVTKYPATQAALNAQKKLEDLKDS